MILVKVIFFLVEMRLIYCVFLLFYEDLEESIFLRVVFKCIWFKVFSDECKGK